MSLTVGSRLGHYNVTALIGRFPTTFPPGFVAFRDTIGTQPVEELPIRRLEVWVSLQITLVRLGLPVGEPGLSGFRTASVARTWRRRRNLAVIDAQLGSGGGQPSSSWKGA